MGQRHMVYAITKGEKGDRVDAIYFQWMFGRTVLVQALNTLKFARKGAGDRYSPFGERTATLNPETALEALTAIYKVMPQEGRIIGLDPCDPVKDKDGILGLDPYGNNDGATVLDLRDLKHPKIAFMFIGGFPSYDVEHFTPMTAEEYVRLYYPAGGSDHYDPKSKGGKSNEKDLARLIKGLGKFELLTAKELGNVFNHDFTERIVA